MILETGIRIANKDPAGGLWTTSFLIRTAFPPWLKSNAAATRESAERSWDRCWTTLDPGSDPVSLLDKQRNFLNKA